MMLSARQLGRAFDRAMRSTLGSYSSDDAFARKVAGQLGADPAFVRRVAEEIRNQADLGERAELALEVELRREAGPAPIMEAVVAEAADAVEAEAPATPAPAYTVPIVELPLGIVSPDPADPAQQPEFAEARDMLRRGAGATKIAGELGWPLAFTQEFCAAERKRR